MKAELRNWRRQLGFTLVELLIVLAMVFLLAAVLLPSLAKGSARARRISCVNRLKDLGLAARVFASDHNDQLPALSLTNKAGSREIAAPSEWIVRYYQSFVTSHVTNSKILICPADTRLPAGRYRPMISQNISYFAAPDIRPEHVDEVMFGDRNLWTNGVPVTSGLVVLRRMDALGWTPKQHGNMGNIGMADGSVQQTTSSTLSGFVRRGTNETLRLVVP